MATNTFDDMYGGTPDPDPEQSARWYRWASFADELVALVKLKSGRALVDTSTNMVASILDNGLDDLVYGVFASEQAGRKGDDSVPRQDLYIVAGTLKNRPKFKPSDSDIAYVRIVPMDLDVKNGAFRDWSHCMEVVEFLRSLGIGPDAIIATGSGGMHLHWRFAQGLDGSVAKRLGRGLRALVMAQFGVMVDSTHEPSRLMRLAGGIRWPKPGEAGRRAPVVVDIITMLDTYSDTDRIMRETERVWESEVARAREHRRLVQADWDGAADDLRALDLVPDRDTWEGRYLLATAASMFSKDVSWAQILEPWGWSRAGVDAKRQTVWTRPHDAGEAVNPRSAVTDWPDDPDTMRCFSTSERTGLSRLMTTTETLEIAGERGVSLTKLQVAAEFWAGGSVRRFMEQYMARKTTR